VEVTDADVPTDAAQALVEELLRTAFSLQDIMGSFLEEMPENAFPGEDNAAVLLEMVVGSCRPATEAAGESACWAATALIGSMRDRVIDDLRAALELARQRQ
jgi:hypothetical protein